MGVGGGEVISEIRALWTEGLIWEVLGRQARMRMSDALE